MVKLPYFFMEINVLFSLHFHMKKVLGQSFYSCGRRFWLNCCRYKLLHLVALKMD